jgi:DNA-binding LytR/AlgR family response regulator
MLRILAVDDEPPALEELVYLLGQDPRVGEVESAGDGGAALRALDHALACDRPVDGLFLDIRMPGLDGLDVARVLSRIAEPPPVVFVSAHDDFAVRAFELQAADYVLKPVRPERLTEAVRRVAELREAGRGAPAVRQQQPAPEPPRKAEDDQVIAVELSGVTRFVHRSDVTHVEAYGDYVRLHLASSSHLLRVPLATLERQWQDAGFVRVHRRHLVATDHVEEVRFASGHMLIRVGGTLLPVSRRNTGRLRELLMSRARPVAGGQR